MYWWCHHCGVWRMDTYVRIDPRTRAPQCHYCNNYLRERLSDSEYKQLLKQHALEVPPPGELQ
ncbi:MAG: hypothetical protein R6U37_07120 [Dehalococcoidia bacterium]